MTSVLTEIWEIICNTIVILQIIDMAASHRIKITDGLHNYNKLLDIPKVILVQSNNSLMYLDCFKFPCFSYDACLCLLHQLNFHGGSQTAVFTDDLEQHIPLKQCFCL